MLLRRTVVVGLFVLVCGCSEPFEPWAPPPAQRRDEPQRSATAPLSGGAACQSRSVTIEGERLTFTRQSTAMVERHGVESTCRPGQLRVGDLGALVEPERTNFFVHSDSPGAQTTLSLPGDGTVYTAWVEGPGTLALALLEGSAWGLPCSAGERAPCTFAITTMGAAAATATRTGALSFAQIENGPQPTTRIRTADLPVTRAAEQLLVPNPITAGTRNWCVEGTYTPTVNRTWTPRRASELLWQIGPELATNYVQCLMVTSTWSSLGIQCTMVPSDGVSVSRIELDFGNPATNSTSMATPGSGSTHRLSLCNEDGWLTLFWDDVQSEYQTFWTGRGAPGLWPGSVAVASQSIDAPFPSSVRDFRITPQPYPSNDRPRYDVLWLGDSTYAMPILWQELARRFLHDGYQLTWQAGTYGGNL